MSRWGRALLGARRRAGSRRDEDLDRELRDHVALEEEDYRAAGLDVAAARAAAYRTLGNRTAIREDVRAVGRIGWLDTAGRDVRHAVRLLRRRPWFTAAAVLTLALGVGANAAMFDLVDALMFRPPDGVGQPDRIVGVGGLSNDVDYVAAVPRVRTLELAAATESPVTVSLGRGVGAEAVRLHCVTETYFSVFGATPAVGRGFSAADDRPDAPMTLVISDALWRRRWNRAPAAIGQRVWIAGRDAGVIGVAPSGFVGAAIGDVVDAWTPLAASPSVCTPFPGQSFLWSSSDWTQTVGRLQPGATLASADAEVRALAPALASRPSRNGRRPAWSVTPLFERNQRLGTLQRLAWWLAGGALALLLIACANLAGLLSIRAVERRREVTVRLQLGATPARLRAQLIVENLVLAVPGGVVALAVAVLLRRILGVFFPIEATGAFLTGRTAAILALSAGLAGLASGFVPAVQTSRWADVRPGHGSRVLTPRSRFRSGLLVAQVALALALVVLTALFVRSLHRVMARVTYDLDHVTVATVDLDRAGYRRTAQVQDLFDAMLDRVRRQPGVESAALSSGAVLGFGGGTTFATSVLPSPTMAWSGTAPALTAVSPGYFTTLGLPMRQGHGFTSADGADREPEIVLDERLADDLWPGVNPVGRCAFLGGRAGCLRIVGVATADQGANGYEPYRVFYLPLGQLSMGQATPPRTIVVRTTVPAARALPVIAAALRGAAPDLPFVDVRTLASLADTQARSWRLGVQMFGLFAVASIVLAAVGLYALLAFSARQRTAEIGLRMALGARPGEVLGLVMKQGVTLLLLGWAVGLACTLLAARWVAGLLYGAASTDWTAFAAGSVVTVVAGLAGCAIPAIRASRIDPTEALRCE